MNFIKNSLREFRHVVWPTREETKKYFVIVLLVLMAFGLFLFVFGSLFGNALRGLKSMVNPVDTPAATINAEIPANTIGDTTLNGAEGEDTPLEIDSINVQGVSVDGESVQVQGVVAGDEVDSQTPVEAEDSTIDTTVE